MKRNWEFDLESSKAVSVKRSNAMRRYQSESSPSTIPLVTGADCLAKDMIKENDYEANAEETLPTSPETEQTTADHPSSADESSRHANTWSNAIKLSPQELINDEPNMSSDRKERRSVKHTERIVVRMKRKQGSPRVSE